MRETVAGVCVPAAPPQLPDRAKVRPLAFLLLWLVAAVVAAQPPHVHFQRLEVAIWPEYDQPAALVMYRGWLAPDVELPVAVTLPMPASVTVPNAVAKRGAGTTLLVASHSIEAAGEWKLVHLQTDLPEVRLEYYVDLAIDGSDRSLTFEWPGGPVIDEVAYEVMQPLAASDFKVTPSSGPSAVGPDGLTYHREELGPVPEGGSFFIEISYSKNNPMLTAAALQPAAPPSQQGGAAAQPKPGPASSAPASPSADSSVWWVVLPIVFLAGIAAGWILLSARKERSS